MKRGHKIPRKYKKSRPYKGKCESCGKKTNEVFKEIDGNNYSITYYKPYLCKECAELIGGKL